ncbi:MULTISPECIES: phosphopantothenate--cysteine ligase [Enterococcus]|uniref:Phosphopantothenate-cysteine ligase n=1 Tax=Enterococcus sulfureus ATCC 49903 TaxID=1140003 RepID=S0NPW7_9ENTE|nr:phosphopantothenate--cysteine ligase [Enterococcus sulfureus]EOT47168.1 phosphopantothenate-cysteine ligase [Enterococcus sulfureus ATCC 49903]EOT83537.1 phosphopantothenate-cysteine ligase [Enterococcus sulfureus ATCC 49903]
MRILVTLGGTSERIDQVREITNQSTGTLGCLIVAEWLAQQATVDAIVTTHAKKPAPHEQLSVYPIHDTADLVTTMTTLLTTHTYDAVIHSMAVSDFTPSASLSQAQLLEALNQWHYTHPNEDFTAQWFDTLPHPVENKLSSATDHLTVILKKTPKVIQLIKQYQPTTLLVGFKLLVQVEQDELIAVAKKAQQTNQADFVLANDLSQITASTHVGYLVNEQGILAQANTKAEIAHVIVCTLVPIIKRKKA